jgi:pyruvate kinase
MPKNLFHVVQELKRVDEFMVEAEYNHKSILHNVHSSNVKRVKNLIHYLALRTFDIRNLQNDLHSFGLSSMASSESHIRGQLLSIFDRLNIDNEKSTDIYNYESSNRSILNHQINLFGKKQIKTIPYIMVTFDNSLAIDYLKVEDLLVSGMNIARINCAHDDEITWLKMIQNIKKASESTRLNCKIYFDLAGPKIRTLFHHKKKLKVFEGKTIYLTDEENLTDSKSTVGCTIPEIMQQLKKGEKVLFDDGLIEAVVEKVNLKNVVLKIVRVSATKPFIKNSKGINFPDSILSTPALTDYDRNCIPFILEHADMIGYSFVRTSNDIEQLQQVIDNENIDLIIKIETPQAVINLPNLLISGLKNKNLGVMIARGDLAVEIGFERMSEIQEEILWICEAAHVPVIWATQVLENLNKTGVATRSEITDAAHSAQADCVMINKGKYTIQTLKTLKNILIMSGEHHIKKRFTFRSLAIAKRFLAKKV